MKKLLSAAFAALALATLTASSAAAFEGGGRKPSEAPLVTVGQHYTGQLNNHNNDVNFGSSREVALWHLPQVTTRDVIVVGWHSVPFTNSPGSFPVCIDFAQGIDDFNWGSVFGESLSDYNCDTPSASGTARTEFVAQEPNSTTSYLEFSSYASETNPADYETYPYDFSVESILHYLSVAMRPVKRVSAGGIVYATANLSSGLPVPDGTSFNLTVTWPGSGIATYTGTSTGGTVGFQLALPETAYGKNADFVVSHSADGTYQGVSSPKLRILVAKPKPPAPTPCELAQRRGHSLAKRLKQLKRRARHARGASRRSLGHRAHRVRKKLNKARREAASLCA